MCNDIKTLNFIKKAINIHNNFYDYSKVVYKNAKDKVIIICKIHGEFYQTPNTHLSKSGCPICSSRKPKKQNDTFISEVQIKHPNLIFEKTVYKGSRKNVLVGCEKHGDFEIHAGRLLKGQGCPICLKEKRSINNTYTNEKFIEMCKDVHGDRYDYSSVLYNGSHSKINITCLKHGVFTQEANNHLQGQGCPKCKKLISKEEIKLENFIKDLGIKTETTFKLKNKKHIDIYLPEYNIGIEYNGLLWHSEEYRGKNYHLNKYKDSIKENIFLIQIFEDEWLLKQEIVKSRLLYKFGKIKQTIYARKCEVRSVDSKTASAFLEENHIQGKCASKHKLGLYYENKLVSLMTFGHTRINMGGKKEENVFELSRFCNKLNTNVIGGASKLLKYFERNYNPKEIISYADLRWSDGSIYYKLGFIKEHVSKPNYFYFKRIFRENRFKYRKSELKRKFNSDMSQTEIEIMTNLGYRRIYDCGNIKFNKKYL